MTAGGWLIMTLSVGGAAALFGWSMYLALTRKPDQSIHSTLDRPPDIDD